MNSNSHNNQPKNNSKNNEKAKSPKDICTLDFFVIFVLIVWLAFDEVIKLSDVRELMKIGYERLKIILDILGKFKMLRTDSEKRFQLLYTTAEKGRQHEYNKEHGVYLNKYLKKILTKNRGRPSILLIKTGIAEKFYNEIIRNFPEEIFRYIEYCVDKLCDRARNARLDYNFKLCTDFLGTGSEEI